jgi:hypothetical protein
MTTSGGSLSWTVDIKSPLVTHYTATHGLWTLLVIEYPQPPTNAPEGHRHLARVYSTHGTAMALKPTWCASLDDAKRLCVIHALLDDE